MKLPDIPAIAIGCYGLLRLTHILEQPSFVSGISGNAFLASCLNNAAKYPGASRICLFIAAGVFLLSGILHMWIDAKDIRGLWGIGAGAFAVLLMIGLNEILFGWAFESSLYSAGFSHVLLILFHFLWEFGCPIAALYVTSALTESGSYTLPYAVCRRAAPCWGIPAAAIIGFAVSLIPYAVLLIILIPLNYLNLVFDKIFLGILCVIALILLHFGIL